MLKHNLVANFLGQGWTALMGFAFVPLYIKYLGVEAYGLIGLFALLNAWLGLLDMGMLPTLNREMARFTGGDRSAQYIRDLLRTIEVIAFAIAILIAFATSISSTWLATYWLKAENLPIPVVAQAFMIMGLVFSLRFVEGIYQSCISGLQKQVFLNAYIVASATLRGAGAVVILVWVSPTIQAFMIWQGLISITGLIVLALVTYSYLPPKVQSDRFSLTILSEVRSFAGGVLGITFFSLLLTHVDKIILSNILTLQEFGYYTLATTISGLLYMLIRPITQAWFPRLCELIKSKNEGELGITYHKGAQLVSVIAGSVAIVFIFHSETLLFIWTNNADLTVHTAPILRLLIIGNLLHSLMWIPYHTQLAHGWTRLALRTNVVAILFVVPAIFWFTPIYGSIGAAWIWILLNVGYVLIGANYMYQIILQREKMLWYKNDILLPIGCAATVLLLLNMVISEPVTILGKLTLILFEFILALLLSSLSAGFTRKWLLILFKNQYRTKV